MPQKDYIIRMIEEFAQVLAEAMGLRRAGRLESVLSLLDRSAARFAGLSLRQLDALPYESLRTLLTVGGTLDVQRCVFLAELRRLEGEVRDQRTGGGAGLASSVVAFRLYGEVVAARGIEGLEERREQALVLADRLRSAPLDPDVRLDLWRFELAAGRFGRAEDALFGVLDERPGDLAVVAEGISAYDSLLDRDDAELAAGGLPRDEVLDGLARLGELRREWSEPAR
jgi:hypothetical protein